MRSRWCPSVLLCWTCLTNSAFTADLNLSEATVVIRGGDLPAAEKIAPTILTEEIARRTGLKWTVTDQWPAKAKAVIALSVKPTLPAWKNQIPASALGSPALGKPEGYSIRVRAKSGDQPPAIFITGTDPRGVMFGVGKLLRSAEWGEGKVAVGTELESDSSPNVPIRGHQLGYRARANSWDAWTPAQFEQYIRDLVVFGANSIENIPFEDSDRSVLMPVSRDVMNIAMGEICARYDVDYWHWTPVEFKLPDAKKQAALLKQHEEFYRACKRVDAIFVPGGDPGDNPALELMIFLTDVGGLLQRYHPKAKIWVSMQGFSPKDVDAFYAFLEEKRPAWFAGAVMGPGSPPLDVTRARLAKNYKLRWYPDITHTVRCQYPVPWFDPAFGVTLGREPVNPRPIDYAGIYRSGYRFTDGFLTYSDGIHDDFNKNLWSALGWNPEADVRGIALDYARYFFRSDLAEAGADALFALETNWRGGLAENSSVDGTLLQWQQLEQKLPAGKGHWRFDMHLMRAYYDAYTRHRLLYETDLQKQAFARLGEAARLGADKTLTQAKETLSRASTQPIRQDWYGKLDGLAESLFKAIGYQTRMERYHASGTERGVVMDFVNYPLNDRWWLEDQFDRIGKLPSDAEKLKRIENLCRWEKPTEGSFYDDVGNVGRSPRSPKLLYAIDGARLQRTLPAPNQRWFGENRRSIRYGWHGYLNWPSPMIYTGLDPKARYTVRLFGQGNSPLMVDGVRAKLLRKEEPVEDNQEQEFEVAPEHLADGRIELTWERFDESHLNWRQWHYVTELWLMKESNQNR
jgi:hypothetical protein